MKEDDKKIIIVDKDGNNLEGEIVFVFEANGDDFVLYEIDGNVYAAKTDAEGTITPVEEDEWKLVEKVFNEFMEDYDDN